eukprot:4256011-Pyramimonas_sp.AAC.1
MLACWPAECEGVPGRELPAVAEPGVLVGGVRVAAPPSPVDPSRHLPRGGLPTAAVEGVVAGTPALMREELAHT